MKKIFAMLLVAAVSMNVMAITYTSKATITLKSADNKTCKVILGESNDLAEGLNSGYYAEINMEGRLVALYGIYEGTNYQQLATKTITNMYLGFMGNASTNYTLDFTNVTGTMSIYDQVADQTINITEGGSYAFTATANETVNNRFVVNYIPSEPTICHRNGRLQVTGMKNSNVVVKNMDDSATTIGTVAITDDYQEITLKGVIAAGQYKVEYNDGTAHTVIIDVQ